MPNEIMHTNKFLNRELSWIDFNERVLKIALDPDTPLLEQAKFNAIFHNNLDEFFMVRVASLKSQVEAGITKTTDNNQSPEQQLIEIREKILPHLQKQQQHYLNHIKLNLAQNDILLLDYSDLNLREKNWIDNYFKSAIFPILTPLAVDPAHPFPFVSNLSLNIAAIINDPETDQKQFSRIKIPQKIISRFVEIPKNINQRNPEPYFSAVPVEQIIAANLNYLFPGMNIEEYSFFRVTRDADLELRDLEADDLMLALEQGLRKRRMGGEIVRLEVANNMPTNILNLLIEGMSVKPEDLYSINGLLGLDALFELLNLNKPSLFFKKEQGKIHKLLKKSQFHLLEDGSLKQEDFESIFSIIKRNDILLHHPFDLFSSSVEEFIHQAANDPLVMGIKMTLYRVSKQSSIIEALIRAAENGKQVLALVELKARFDEDNNIQWAKQLEKSGVHVVYGVIGLKTHTKIALVIRKEKDRLRTYFHIGSGNYNSKTSKTYTDIGLLSVQPELGQDLIELFNYLTGFSKQQSFRKLLVAPVSLRKGIEHLIKQEIENVKNGKEGEIIAKVNSLVDRNIINLLYEASQIGVKIKLIVRGMCCLIPQQEGVSENINVVSIIGRYLEHSRIFWFRNNNNPKVFIGSADLMRRNLDRRVEAVTPIENPKLIKQLEKILTVYLTDNENAWEMQDDGMFFKKVTTNQKICAQEKFMNEQT